MEIVNAFTVDVEDYYHVAAFADYALPDSWDRFESRVVANTRRVMHLLDRHGVRATFFVLGWVAEKFPHLVREIHEAGHELGCHSHWHRPVFELTPEEFREDVRRSTAAIAEATGCRVVAYRAPSFSITRDSLWALEILVEEGFVFDSSIFPVVHDRYGIPNAERYPHLHEFAGGRLWEFPPSVRRQWGWNWPIAGGGYFRLYPAWLSRRWLQSVIDRDGEPVMFYIHPWELDPDQPRMPGSVRSRLRHYQNLRSTEQKLDRLLGSFRFGSLTDALERRNARLCSQLAAIV